MPYGIMGWLEPSNCWHYQNIMWNSSKVTFIKKHSRYSLLQSVWNLHIQKYIQGANEFFALVGSIPVRKFHLTSIRIPIIMVIKIRGSLNHLIFKHFVMGILLSGKMFLYIWMRSRNWGCLVPWFCYQLIAKPGNKTAAVPWPHPYYIGKGPWWV